MIEAKSTAGGGPVNGVPCPPSRAPLPSPMHPVVQTAKGYDVPVGTLHEGYNYVEASSAIPRETAHELFWVEIMVRPA